MTDPSFEHFHFWNSGDSLVIEKSHSTMSLLYLEAFRQKIDNLIMSL